MMLEKTDKWISDSLLIIPTSQTYDMRKCGRDQGIENLSLPAKKKKKKAEVLQLNEGVLNLSAQKPGRKTCVNMF